MTEEDKILITAFADDDLNDSETAYVENLLKIDESAKEYLNNIKRANIDINEFFDSSEFSELHKKIDLFLSTLKPKNNFFKSFLLNYYFMGAGVSALLLIFIFLPYGEDIDKDFIVYDFSESDLSRGLNEDQDALDRYSSSTFKELLNQTITDMNYKNLDSAIIKTRSYEIKVFIDGKTDIYNLFGRVMMDGVSVYFKATGIDSVDEKIIFEIIFEN